LKEGYIKGVREDRPAVVQLNGLIASLAVSELLAGLHPYRDDPNGSFAVHRVPLKPSRWVIGRSDLRSGAYPRQENA
jgi:hypothetical protein